MNANDHSQRVLEIEAEELYAFIWNIVQYGPGKKTRSAALDCCWELTNARIESKRLQGAVAKARPFAKRHGWKKAA